MNEDIIIQDGKVVQVENQDVVTKEFGNLEEVKRELEATKLAITDINNFKQRRLDNLSARKVELETAQALLERTL